MSDITGIVSIHAPARGRTYLIEREWPKPYVSIHAPARGRTSTLCFTATRHRCFNPRPRAGANEAAACSCTRERVSIHAPARGRTRYARRAGARAPFQSTPPRGGEQLGGRRLPTIWMVSIHAPARGRTYCFHRSGFALLFQSTPPRGGERSPRNHPAHYTSFNPRPRAGANFAVGRSWGDAYVSIHAPARGRTWY